MADSLSGMTALVTGGAKRLGRAIVLALAREGAHIVIHCNRSRLEAERTASEARAAGVKAWVVTVDLAKPAPAERLMVQARKRAGRAIRFLVNNAAIFPAGRLGVLTAAELARNIQINAFAPLQLSRAFARQFRRTGPGLRPCILNLLDCRIADYDQEHAAYHLSKRMLADLTRMMALAFAPAVRVNAVAPGLILPPAGQGEAYLRKLARTNPLRTHGEAGDIAVAAVFLLQSRFVTGQILYVDGGRHLKKP